MYITWPTSFAGKLGLHELVYDGFLGVERVLGSFLQEHRENLHRGLEAELVGSLPSLCPVDADAWLRA